MLSILRLISRLAEFILAIPARLASLFLVNVAFNPRLGPLRYVALGAVLFVCAALLLVYVVAPIRGAVGATYLAGKLRYDAERWVATAIYDGGDGFAGTYDPRLDSQRDVNFSGRAIEVGGYVANPDHKSIPVRTVPEDYWKCLIYHEDRYLGGWRNPYGIDLVGVLKIPLSTISRTIRLGRPSLGVGGSTLPMQFARVIYKTPPRVDESPWEKLGRKLSEWWLAPVIYHELTRGGDIEPLKRWASNHLWLAQRTGGAPLHGVEVTSRIVFGVGAADLTRAQQFVLASAVNKPIILLPGSDSLNRVRQDRWRYIAEVRASKCATELIADPEEQKKVILELVEMAGGPPDPKVRPRLEAALETYAPSIAKRAKANPRLRANVLLPSARLGAREEMKQAFGFNWRAHVRGLSLTMDAAENLGLRAKLTDTLAKLDRRWQARLKPGFTLDPAKAGRDLRQPDIIVAAADHRNRIVRYYESSQFAPYFGSILARDRDTGRYDPAREGRAIASTGKMLAAVGIATTSGDTLAATYFDRNAPSRGLETCRRGGGLRRNRTAEVAFACSLNGPLEWRAARVGQAEMRRLIDGFGFRLPPTPAGVEPTPPSTAAVRGLIAGAPRTVHHMSAILLAALTGRGNEAQPAPSLIRSFDFVTDDADDLWRQNAPAAIRPNDLLPPAATPQVKAFLQAPLCYRAGRRSYGTLADLDHWCAARRADLKLHFAKTGTQVNADPDETVDVWATGGLQFSNGAAYSYVILVGSGTPTDPFARSLHSTQVAAPLLDVLLKDLAGHAARNPVRPPQRPRTASRRPARTDTTNGNPFGSSGSARGTGDDRGSGFSIEGLFERIAGR